MSKTLHTGVRRVRLVPDPRVLRLPAVAPQHAPVHRAVPGRRQHLRGAGRAGHGRAVGDGEDCAVDGEVLLPAGPFLRQGSDVKLSVILVLWLIWIVLKKIKYN